MRHFTIPVRPYVQKSHVCHNSYGGKACDVCFAPVPDNATEAAIVQRLDTPHYGGTVPRTPVEAE